MEGGGTVAVGAARVCALSEEETNGFGVVVDGGEAERCDAESGVLGIRVCAVFDEGCDERGVSGGAGGPEIGCGVGGDGIGLGGGGLGGGCGDPIGEGNDGDEAEEEREEDALEAMGEEGAEAFLPPEHGGEEAAEEEEEGHAEAMDGFEEQMECGAGAGVLDGPWTACE